MNILHQSLLLIKKAANTTVVCCVCDGRYCNEISCFLLYLVNDSLECFRVVDSKVSEDLTIDFDACLVKETHEL